MRLLVVGDPVVTLVPGERPIARGAVVVEDGRIAAVGRQSDFPSRDGFDEVLGSNDELVLPGLFNAHLHGEGAFGHGIYDGPWEKANVWYHEDLHAAAEEDIETLLTWWFLGALRTGTTGAIDFFYGRPAMADLAAECSVRAYRASGIRAALALASRDQNVYVHRPDDEVLAELEPEHARTLHGSPVGYAYPVVRVFETFRTLAARHHDPGGTVRLMLAPDWTPSCSDQLLLANKRLAAEHDTTLQIHLLETRHEALWNWRTHGRSGVRRLHDLGFLGPEVSGAHCVWATDEDLRILADTGVTVVNNPGSNLRLTSGISPVRDLLDAGVRVAVGSDGISTNDDNDLLMEVRLGGLLQRLPGSDGRLSSETLLRNACVNGARAAGWNDVGELRKGYRADVVCLDKREFAWPPSRFAEADPVDVIVDRAQGRHVTTTLVEGRVVVRDGSFVEHDEQRLRCRVEEASERLFQVPPELLSLRPAVEALYVRLLDWYARRDGVPLAARHAYNTRDAPFA